MRHVLLTAAAVTTLAGSAMADDAELAQQLTNPVASLVSAPFQLNYDQGYGSEDGHRTTLNIQPVAPFSLGENWNVISRTILPVIWQDDIAGASGNQFGLGDITQSFFFSPKQPTARGLIWGAGPAFLIPSSTDDKLGVDAWGIGPTVVALKLSGPWTYGMLANHIWSVAGDDDVSSTFIQPFLSYTTPTAWTFTVNSESTYDWEQDTATVPVNAVVSKLVTINHQAVSFGAGARYWVESPDNGPDGFGLRLIATLLFPK